jgi:hypothetical protein
MVMEVITPAVLYFATLTLKYGIKEDQVWCWMMIIHR